MATVFVHRLLIVVPVAKVTAVTAWIQANIAANAVPSDLGPGLNTTGLDTDPITHRWCSTALPDGAARQILARLCQFASVTPPSAGTWNGWSAAQKIAWLQGVRAALFSGYGVWVSLSRNETAWDSPQDALTATGLKVARAAVV